MMHTPRFVVSQIQEYTRVTIECNGTSSKITEDVHASRGQLVQVPNGHRHVNEAGDCIPLRPHDFGGITDVYVSICQFRPPPPIQMTVPLEKNSLTFPISPGTRLI